MPTRSNTRRKRLRSALASQPEPWTVPTRWVKAVLGVFLLPLAGTLTQTFFSSFSRATLEHGFWSTEEFWFFSLGTLLFLIAFVGLPKPVIVYVFGHELTHAIWVWLMGGRVSEIRVHRHGGHILTDTHNFWIALAPYFYPIYSIALLVVYGIASLFVDVMPYHRWFFALLGATWAFHVSFTLWMIPKGQTDLTYHGTFFSLVVIFVMNIVALSLMLIIASPHVTLAAFTGELYANVEALAVWVFGRLNDRPAIG